MHRTIYLPACYYSSETMKIVSSRFAWRCVITSVFTTTTVESIVNLPRDLSQLPVTVNGGEKNQITNVSEPISYILPLSPEKQCGCSMIKLSELWRAPEEPRHPTTRDVK